MKKRPSPKVNSFSPKERKKKGQRHLKNDVGFLAWTGGRTYPSLAPPLVVDCGCVTTYLFTWFLFLSHVSMFSSFWAAAPKGSMTYAFTHMGSFLLLLLLHTPPPQVSRPISQPPGQNPILKAQIPIPRPKSHSLSNGTNHQPLVRQPLWSNG